MIHHRESEIVTPFGPSSWLIEYIAVDTDSNKLISHMYNYNKCDVTSIDLMFPM